MKSPAADTSEIATRRGKKTGYSSGAGSNLDGIWKPRPRDDLRL